MLAPAARRVVEDAGASGAAALAAAVARKVPGRDLIPAPTDHARPASVAIGALRCLVVNVAGVYVAEAHAAGNVPRRHERRRRGRRPVEHLPVGVEGREMERHVGTEMLEDPGAQRLEVGRRVVLARDQERSDLEPDPSFVLQVGERLEHSTERAGAEFLVEGFREALEVDVGGIDVAIELLSRRIAHVAGGNGDRFDAPRATSFGDVDRVFDEHDRIVVGERDGPAAAPDCRVRDCLGRGLLGKPVEFPRLGNVPVLAEPAGQVAARRPE